MRYNNGVIPTALGIAATTIGATWDGIEMKRKGIHDVAPMVAAGVLGFGLAHILLGSIDLYEHKNRIL